MSRLTDEQVIEKLKDGWELGLFAEWRGSARAIFQRRLCGGGESIPVHRATINSMLRRRVLEFAPRKKEDAFWLTRIQLGPRAP